MKLTIKTYFLLYWVALHLVFAAAMFWFLREDRLWLLVVELLVVLSAAASVKLIQLFLRPLETVKRGIEMLRDSNLSSALLPAGQVEIDTIIKTYNKMLNTLRLERMRIQEKHYFLEKIVAATHSAILTFDFDGQITLVNPAAQRLLNATEDLLLGKQVLDLPAPFDRFLAELPIGKSEIVHLPSYKRLKCTKLEFFDQGFPRQFVVLEELTEELRLSEKAAYEKLIRVISHEINNSIGAANSLLHTCLSYKEQLDPDDREDYETALQVVISRTEHLNAFMRSYANVIRLGTPQKQLYNIVELLEKIVFLFKAQLNERQITVQWQLAPQTEKYVHIDRSQIEQVLVNVVKNAMEAIGQQGRITLSLYEHERSTVVAVADTGAGIPPDVRANLFTPFYSTKENGQGIGLTMIQEILNRHDFPFSLESELGQGTVFKIEMR